jgi:hypothetical protein
MRFLIFAAITLLFAPSALAQTVPDLSESAIGYQAEMLVTYTAPSQSCAAPSAVGPTPFNAPDWTRCDTTGQSWTFTHDAVDLATCEAQKQAGIDSQIAWERFAAEKAGVSHTDLPYVATCQCKGGGTTGC